MVTHERHKRYLKLNGIISNEIVPKIVCNTQCHAIISVSVYICKGVKQQTNKNVNESIKIKILNPFFFLCVA